MNPDTVLLTRREAADLLRVSIRTLHTYISNKTIPVCRLGGRVLIRRAALDSLMEKLETPAAH